MKKLVITLFTNTFCILFLAGLFFLYIFLFALNFVKETISRDLFVDISLISMALVWICSLGFVVRNVYLWRQYTLNIKIRQIIIVIVCILAICFLM